MGRERQDRNARSRRQEAKRARDTGGRVQAGSGSSWRATEDVKTSRTLEQLKFTDRKSYALKAEELQRTLRNAHNTGRDAVLIIDFEQHDIRATIHIGRIP